MKALCCSPSPRPVAQKTGAPRVAARRCRALLAAGVATVTALLGGCGDDKPAGPAKAGSPPVTPGFEERGEAAGISFRMTYLRDEQGESFKINLYDHGSAVAVGDYDGDGRDDVYFCNELGRNALYHNLGDGRFEDVTAKAGGDLGLADVISVAASWGDYDGDGREDLYVATTMGGNHLFHGEGAGRFADVTKQAGLELVRHSQSVTWFDANGDGLLDLLVSNTAKWTSDEIGESGHNRRGAPSLLKLVLSEKEESVFYRNRGDGTFEDATAAAGFAGTGWSGDTAVLDFDEDGDLDVMVVNMFGASRLYRNDGKGYFTDVARSVLGKVSWGAVGTRALDYDDDGHLDLLLVDMHSDMWMNWSYAPNAKDSATKFSGFSGPVPENEFPPDVAEVVRRLDIQKKDVVFGNTLFHALGGGRFEEVSDRAHVETFWPWGVAAADYDGDGYEDLFIPSGMGYPYQFQASPLLMNTGRGTFVDRTAESGLVPYPGGEYAPGQMRGRPISRSARSAATADFDGDGRVDIVVNNFNDRAFLLMNRYPKKPWVGFRLVGSGGNRDAIGAVVRLRVGSRTMTRLVQAAGGYLAQSSLALHFGLDDSQSVDGCEITWPGGAKQSLSVGKDFQLGRVNRVEQGR